MKVLEIKGHKIELYDGIEEMPVVRYNKYTKYCVLSTGVGNTVDDIVSRIAAIRKMIGKENVEKQMDSELLTLAQTFHFCTNCVDPSTLAFASLVKSVDGEECNDVTDEGIEKVKDRLSEFVTRKDVTLALSGVKKKSMGSWGFTFRNRMARMWTWRPRR